MKAIFYTVETSQKADLIIHKLQTGLKFGIYEGGKACYFEDGTRVDYEQLWDSLRKIHNLGKSHNKTLYELCPDTYMGVFGHKFNKFVWPKSFLRLIPGMH